MRQILLSLLYLLSSFVIWAVPKDMAVKNPEVVNAKDIGIEFFDNMVIVYRIQRGTDNIIEAYVAEYGPERIDLQPIGAFREENIREYRPLAMPPKAYIEGLLGDNPIFISSNVTYLLEESVMAKKINPDNKQMLRVYADFLADPDSYPGISSTPIPGEVEKMMDLYEQKVSTQKHIARIDKQQKSDNNNSLFRWGVIVLIIPIGLLFWLMIATSGMKVAVNFNSKIRAIALVECLTIVLGVSAAFSFPMVNWPWIVLGVIAILVALWLFLCLSYRVYEHVKFAGRGSFPWPSAICFGCVGMLSVYQLLALIVLFSLDAMQVIQIEDGYGAKDTVLGIVLAALILCALGWWYYKSIIKHAPQLSGSFIWIAIASIVAAITVALLIVVIIALLIFKWTGKAYLQSGQNVDSKNNNGIGHNCSTCRHTSMLRCTIYPEHDKPPFNCPHYDPY